MHNNQAIEHTEQVCTILLNSFDEKLTLKGVKLLVILNLTKLTTITEWNINTSVMNELTSLHRIKSGKELEWHGILLIQIRIDGEQV